MTEENELRLGGNLNRLEFPLLITQNSIEAHFYKNEVYKNIEDQKALEFRNRLRIM